MADHLETVAGASVGHGDREHPHHPGGDPGGDHVQGRQARPDHAVEVLLDLLGGGRLLGPCQAVGLQGWLQPVVEANPITVVAEALRALTSDGPAVGPVLQSIAWITGLTLVFAPLAVARYRRLA